MSASEAAGGALRRFWTLLEAPATLTGSPWRVAVCLAPDIFAARAVLQPADGRQISELVTWWLFEKLDGLAAGERLELVLDRLPSAYDEWSYGPGLGHDFRAMEEAGKEVT